MPDMLALKFSNLDDQGGRRQIVTLRASCRDPRHLGRRTTEKDVQSLLVMSIDAFNCPAGFTSAQERLGLHLGSIEIDPLREH